MDSTRLAVLAGALLGFTRARAKRRRLSGAVLGALAGYLFATKAAPALGIRLPSLPVGTATR